MAGNHRQSTVLRSDEEYPEWLTSTQLSLSPEGGLETEADMKGGPVTVLEICEKDQQHLLKQDSSHRPVKMFQTYKGQLRIAIYINCGLLTVHVIEAKHLQSGYNQECNAYIRVSIVPDKVRKSKCKSSVVNQSNDPLFDEKFSFELLDSDNSKRLLISAWHRTDGGSSEFLGCMSFGIKRILQKPKGVQGWYHLLSEFMGQRKHLHAKIDVAEPNSTHCSSNHSVVSSIDSTQSFTEEGSFVHSCGQNSTFNLRTYFTELKKTDESCGLTLTGGAPAQVCRVEPGSAAENAGLQPGDRILAINEHNVQRCAGKTVATLLRNCEGCVKLHVGSGTSSSSSNNENNRSIRQPLTRIHRPTYSDSNSYGSTSNDMSLNSSTKSSWSSSSRNPSLYSSQSSSSASSVMKNDISMTTTQSGSSSHSDYGSWELTG